MSFSELFDGEEFWLGVDCDPGWRTPHLEVLHVVDLDPQPVKMDNLESPLTNLVTAPVSAAKQASWAVEDGWQAFAVMFQYVGDLMTEGADNDLEVEQRVVRNEKTWAVKSSHYRVFWKGDDVEC
jgi:hypothetical protein